MLENYLDQFVCLILHLGIWEILYLHFATDFLYFGTVLEKLKYIFNLYCPVDFLSTNRHFVDIGLSYPFHVIPFPDD